MRPDKEMARTAGVPTWLRRYHARYAKRKARHVAYLLMAHQQHPAPMLDHGRDRANKLRAALMGIQSLAPRAPIEGLPSAA